MRGPLVKSVSVNTVDSPQQVEKSATRQRATILNIVGQGYNGVSVMSGRENAVKALICCVCLNALFVHCQSHYINLSIWSSSNMHEVQAVHMTTSDVYRHFTHGASIGKHQNGTVSFCYIL